jgi:phosphatidate cytidylyltransferase
MATPLRIRVHIMSGAAATLFGVLYVPFLASFAVVILSSTTSRALVLWILGLTFLYDVSAFFIGRYWGRRPLAHTISPKKSWEGLIGATFVTLLASALMGPLPMGPITSIGRAMGLGGIVVVFAPLGDLAESVLKRDLGLKDMGSILPGHGGMLDRIDSLLFVLPAAYYFLRVVG